MTPPGVTNSQLYEKVSELQEMIGECHRALKGHNGTPGLVARMDTMEKLLTNELHHLGEKVADLSERNERVDKAKDDPAVVRWPYLLEKFIAPITVAIILYIITHFLLK